MSSKCDDSSGAVVFGTLTGLLGTETDGTSDVH